MSDIGFALNYTNLHEIEIPGRGWARIGAGIQSVDPSGNEESDQTGYYDGEGLASTLITGGQVTLAFSGHRKYGDAAQDYIASLALEYGSARNTRYRWTAPDGQRINGQCTIANIKPGGGDANSKSSFEFELHLNGRPTLTAGDASGFPTSITASDITAAVGASASVGAAVLPNTASNALAYAVENDEIATVSSDGIVTGIMVGQTKLSIKSMVKPSVAVEVGVSIS